MWLPSDMTITWFWYLMDTSPRSCCIMSYVSRSGPVITCRMQLYSPSYSLHTLGRMMTFKMLLSHFTYNLDLKGMWRWLSTQVWHHMSNFSCPIGCVVRWCFISSPHSQLNAVCKIVMGWRMFSVWPLTPDHVRVRVVWG